MKYPILLVHGMGFRDDHAVGYWGRIPQKLKDNGFSVYFSNQDSNGSIESNSLKVAESIDNALKAENAEKVNIIAHSKGGLEARYAASSLGCSDKIASITTLSTPHNGSKTVDSLMKIPEVLIKGGCKVTDLWFRILGDKNPDTFSAICSFRTKDAQRFNEQNPDIETIYYQSYAFVMKHAWSDMFMWLPSLVVRRFDGENDGLLSPESVKWGNFKGVVKSIGNRGISHCDEVDMRRSRLTKKQGDGIIVLPIKKHSSVPSRKLWVCRNVTCELPQGAPLADIPEFYLEIAKQLEQMGF
ncbi:MAG: esterase/lipase family protein [Oscillospiraceae bacterium]